MFPELRIGMQRMMVAAGMFVVALLFTQPAFAKRVALIIGNGAYSKVPALANPIRDSAAMEALFKAASFDVVRRLDNLGVTAMRKALRDFSDQAREAEVAVVFYAGHGMEVNGINYLIPVDAILERDIDVEDEAVPLDRIVQLLEQAKRLRLVILDACRDNPFVRTLKRTVAGRSIGQGLAKVDVLTADTLIAYSAKAGSTASDGQGANSPYTSALLRHLTTPGLDVRLALGRVRDEVLRGTASRQEPFVYGSLGGAEIALVATRATTASDFSGIWFSKQWGDLVLRIQENTVQGTYEYPSATGIQFGHIEGNVEGSRLNFSWWQGQSKELTYRQAAVRGDGYMIVLDGGKKLEGKWRTAGKSIWDGDWVADRRN